MDANSESVDPQSFTCENCSAQVINVQKFCSQCSFPENGTSDEKRAFRTQVSTRKRFIRDAQEKVNSTKVIMLVLAGLFLVFGLYMGFGSDDFAGMVTNTFLCLVFLILAAWCTHNPFGATLTALIIYCTLVVVNAFVDPSTIVGGIVIKVVIIATLVKGIRSAQQAQQHRKELEKLKAAPLDE